jgi:hypothetical protein
MDRPHASEAQHARFSLGAELKPPCAPPCLPMRRVFIPLPGVHKLPAKCIQVMFETESFDVTVRNPAQGIQHKLAFQQ